MFYHLKTGLVLIAAFLTGPSLCTPSPHNAIVRDVCVIGGGSAGTYTAINLRLQGQSVVVIEKQGQLGGHTQTYTDPTTGGHDDIGVVYWHNLTVVTDYFAHFGIPLAAVAAAYAPGVVVENVDLRTGKSVPGFDFSTFTAADLYAYTAQLEKYPYLNAGFDLPDPVPSDLLLPFGEFIHKYNLSTGIVQTIFEFNQGAGDILRQPTLYMIKLFGLDNINSLVTAFLTTAQGDNSLLYEAALRELGSDALLNSTVVSTDRSSNPDHASIVVSTPSGLKHIKAKTVVLAIPPKLDNLEGWDLSRDEMALFGQFQNTAYYTGLLNNTGISANATFNNVAPTAPYNLPRQPVIYQISQSTIPGLFDVKYGAQNHQSDAQVKANIFAALERLEDAGLINGTSLAPNFVDYSSHTPFLLTVPTAAIEDGFYRKLYGLQGQMKTFYTGAAWQTEDSSLIWRFTKALLPAIVKATTASGT